MTRASSLPLTAAALIALASPANAITTRRRGRRLIGGAIAGIVIAIIAALVICMILALLMCRRRRRLSPTAGAPPPTRPGLFVGGLGRRAQGPVGPGMTEAGGYAGQPGGYAPQQDYAPPAAPPQAHQPFVGGFQKPGKAF
ncbi:hypothetical protein K488DRAFT_88730 [Vararia minispora EC-137]|uniref:Uncharacterized protein n=1 Tax=Vararia minispora EC-137 TaxID=1314806 RepID=A0ACB8QDR7_9AGAM|nr:hypothetical protein K488DRAFT_88730 [Vararia minispora EC-137]